MRLLHCGTGNLYGGIETVLVTLAKLERTQKEFTNEFALCFTGRLREELQTAGVPVHMLGNARFSRPWTVWRARRALAALLQRTRFDAAICHGAWPHALAASVIRRYGCRLVFWAHGKASRGNWLERKASRVRPELVIANSRYTTSTIPLLFPETRTEVIYCPVSEPESGSQSHSREQVRAAMGVAKDRVVIVQVSRLESWKGHTLLLAALKLLPNQSAWECWIVGGPQRPEEAAYLNELKSIVAHSELTDRVRFLGQRSDVAQLLAAADIHCQPNLGPEPFGITFVEALYAGLPVVTTAIGGALEIIDATCGILVPPENPLVLAEQLSMLIREPETRIRLGLSGPARARQLCGPNVIAARLHALLSGANVSTQPTVDAH